MCVCLCMYVCLYVCMYVCMYICFYVYNLFTFTGDFFVLLPCFVTFACGNVTIPSRSISCTAPDHSHRLVFGIWTVLDRSMVYGKLPAVHA